MKQSVARILSITFALSFFGASNSQAQVTLLAIGNLTGSRAGSYTDLSHLNYTLENGVAANYLGGLGSAITNAGGDTLLALPDRGPNAVPFDSNIDDTVSYINRFHTLTMKLRANKGSGLPFTLTPTLQATNLLWSFTPLTYGSADAIVGSGVPPLNHFFFHFFTGRSDNFDPSQNSDNPNNGRFDTEGIRVSNDGFSVFISDEYGPYVYQFDRLSGVRLRSFQLPSSFYVEALSSHGAVEISGNTSGRVANKGMEGLAITPDGKTLVGIMQNALIQDAAAGDDAKNLLRIVTIDIASGAVTHQYGYLLTTGSGVSEILALNNNEFLVDERDGKGRGDGSNAKIKQLFKIDLSNAVDISDKLGLDAAASPVSKTLFLDLVPLLTNNGIAASNIPAKIEGISFGADVKQGKTTYHALWIANDNDFLQTVPDPSGNLIDNPNQFFVVGFTDADLGGSTYSPQRPRPLFE
jgi:Esterase-like activity of phytase